MSKPETTKTETKHFKGFFNNTKIIGLAIIAVVFTLFLVFFNYNFFDRFENITLGWRFKHFHSNVKPSGQCIVVGISSKSIKRFGKWPWSRAVFAELIEALDFYGAKSVSFDVAFVSPNEYDSQGDKLFVKAVEEFQKKGKAITFGTFFDSLRAEEIAYNTEDYEKLKEISIKPQTKLLAITARDVFSKFTDLQAKEYKLVLQKPYDEMFRKIKSLGIFNVISKDPVIINEPLFAEFKSMYFATLGPATYLNTHRDTKIIQKEGYVLFDETKIPVDGQNEMMINWYHPPEGRQVAYDVADLDYVYDAYKFLKETSKTIGLSKDQIQDKIEQLYECGPNGTCSEELIKFEQSFPEDTKAVLRKDYKDRYVFIGLLDQSAGFDDLIQTPIAQSTPGVYLHANVLDNILQKDFIKKIDRFSIGVIVFILICSLVVTVLSLKNPKYSFLIGLIYLCYIFVPFLLFKYFKVYTDIVYTEGAVLAAFILSIWYQWWLADHDKLEIRQVFSSYIAPSILKELLSDPSKVELGGKRKEISILFSDIRGFTTISEQSTPEGVVLFLNEFFDAMVEEIMKTQGTVDKFIGDAIMAFWGAPKENKDHAVLAVKAAIGMSDALNKLKKKWADEGKNYPEVNIGIGINTGEAIVGNVGSSEIKSYTIIGDSVNLASRLEGLNKKYDNHELDAKHIIISEHTYEKVKDIFEVEYLGNEKVKGKNIGVDIYRVTGIKGDKND